MKGKSRVELAYHLDVCPDGNQGVTVSRRDLRFVSIDGVDAQDPSLAPQIRKLTPVIAAIAALVIDDEGRFQGVRGWEDVLDVLEAVLPEGWRSGDRPADLRDRGHLDS